MDSQPHGRFAATPTSRFPKQISTKCSAATRAPSGSNRQPFRFMVFTDSERSQHVKQLIAQGAQSLWNAKRSGDGTTKVQASKTIHQKPGWHGRQHYRSFADAPVLVLPPHPLPRTVANRRRIAYPACQTAARRPASLRGVLTALKGSSKKNSALTLRFPERLHLPQPSPSGSSRLTRPCSAQTPVEPRLRRHMG